MIKILKYTYIVFFVFSFQNVLAQTKISSEEEEVYRAYLEQVTSLLEARGMERTEVELVLAEYKNNNIKSDKDLATVIGKLYPSDRDLAVIFYFFKNDSLRTTLFEPGKIIAQQTIAIAANTLLELSSNINQSLNLYQSSANKSPQQRGVSLKYPSNNKKSFDQNIEEATKILLPKSFTIKYKHLIVIPAYNISAIPFHLLKPYSNNEYLIDHCSYSIAPSIIDLVVLRYKMLRKKLPENKFSVIKNIFSATAERNYNEVEKNTVLHTLDSTTYLLKNPLFVSNPNYPTNNNYVFPNLDGAKKEVENAVKYATKYKLFDGKNALKDSVLKYIPFADVAYFATHGIASYEDPMNKSFLVLSDTNSFLTAKDIMNTRLKKTSFPEMVVLSACQTGLGKFMHAGTVGLARAFLIAGSNHVIMSLWNVDDQATAYLMNAFIKYLNQKTAYLPSGALQKAILETKAKYNHPSKWAGFAMFGINY